MTRLLVTFRSSFLIPFAAACFALSAAPAMAQDDDEEIPGLEDEDEEEALDDSEDAEEEDVPADDEPGEEAPAAAGADGPDTANADGDEAQVETIYAIQGKQRLVGGRFEIAPQIMQSVNDRFVSQTGLLLSGIYHIKENMAVEASVGAFGYWNPFDGDLNNQIPRFGGRYTDTTIELRDRERLAPEPVKLYWMNWVATADLQWSPIYGKVSVQDLFLGQFSAYLSVGAGVVGLEILDQTDTEPDPASFNAFGIDGLPPTTVTATVGGGLRFYFLDWLGVRFEVRDYVMALAAESGIRGETLGSFEVRNALMAQLGVSFLF